MKKRTPNPEKIRQALEERCPHGNLVICHQCLADRNRGRINPLAQLAPGTHYIEVAAPKDSND